MNTQPIGNASDLAPEVRAPLQTVIGSHASGDIKPVETDIKKAVTQTQKTEQNVQADSPPSKERLQEALGKINQFFATRASDVQFSVDEETGMRVVKVVDRSNQEVIRQIPSEEALKIAQSLSALIDKPKAETPQGVLLRQKA
ncbi:MAG: flagellar protein FlaG [Pseudomonadota bacterium]